MVNYLTGMQFISVTSSSNTWPSDVFYYNNTGTGGSSVNYFSIPTTTTATGGMFTWCQQSDNATVFPIITTQYYYYSVPEISLSEKMKQIIAGRCAPMMVRNRKFLDVMPDIREIRARQTLKRVIGEEKFQNFIKKGFISVRAKSGKWYQIFPGSDVTRVYLNGKMVERLCVVLIGNFPPTDSLIMRYLLILNNEQEFRKLANVMSPVFQEYLPKQPDQRTLVEIFASLKKKAAA